SSYNGNGWRTLIAHDKAGQLARYGYDYDKEGNRHYEERQHDPTRSQAYQYDAANRLVNLKQGTLVGNTVPAPTTKTTWTLDGVGNWDQTVVDAVTTLRTHNNMNEVINIDGAALAYDANGNPTSDALYAYTYDGENRVATVTRKSDSRVVGTYSYDALDRRIIVIADPVSGPVETRFFYDGSSVIEEQDAATTTLATYVLSQHADDVLTMDRGGQTYYYLENDMGSSGALTNAAGNVVENYVYDGYGGVTITDGAGAAVPATAWGTAQSALDNPYRFTARRFDEETGLYHFRARTFDPGKGRFLQRDPMGYVQGVMNLYAYVDGMPTKATDPTGRVQWKIDLYDKDWPSADDHVARFFFEYDWKCKLVSKGKCEVVFTSGPRAWNTPYETQGAALTNFAIKEKEDDSCYKVRWTASGSWNEWNLWGALGGAAAGGAAVSGGVITISGGTATVNPVGWVVIAGGAVGGSIAGALTFSDDKTATLDIAWRICCECRESDGKCQKKGPTLVNKNINNSTGDLVWRTPK
ncbi:MAG: RHS repeat-associated core domain-containing protein, partial [Myxococcota bacterium]|nr:RHS repeat-associated core domain-containing protein [Myxococcota bacterium]